MSVKESILEVDIAIVGAGPTGLTLANLLGAWVFRLRSLSVT
ncbi:FAD-dependent monooxygenase (plasmid) [Rhizobium bangladeshense]|nr:FAD-dependent monooxygenase [Rhizobium bangladeshense]QSY98062.1 FAD-dependent monooxygenase [Rhizobium bangladeshense]